MADSHTSAPHVCEGQKQARIVCGVGTVGSPRLVRIRVALDHIPMTWAGSGRTEHRHSMPGTGTAAGSVSRKVVTTGTTRSARAMPLKWVLPG